MGRNKELETTRDRGMSQPPHLKLSVMVLLLQFVVRAGRSSVTVQEGSTAQAHRDE
jgi:hypothetical protein